MAWNTTSTLTSPAVSYLAVEKSTLTLFHEFLEGWFSGTSHTLNGAAITFPLVSLSFQETDVPQELNGVNLHMVWWREQQPRRHRLTTALRMLYLPATWIIYIRAKGNEGAEGGPKVRCRNATDSLFGLLNSTGHTNYLAQKGIHKLRCSSSATIPSSLWEMREVRLTGRIKVTF